MTEQAIEDVADATAADDLTGIEAVDLDQPDQQDDDAPVPGVDDD